MFPSVKSLGDLVCHFSAMPMILSSTNPLSAISMAYQ